MEARELRIGNLIRQVDYVTGETICIRTVTSINKEGYLNVKSKGIENIKSQLLKSFEPIPLTEEILLKCGFDKYSDHSNEITYLSKDSGYFIQVYDNSVYFGLNYEDYRKEVKYLHQLQNLYFALTGQELEINL